MDLCEDLARKEDQSRLNRCKDLFASISADNVDSVVPEVIGYLHDTWSVIRSECGKQLAQVAQFFKVTFVSELLRQCVGLSHWQEIHGSILGLTALLSVVKNETTVINEISELCLDLIGHVNIPVKEAARVCLINVQKQRQDKTILLHKIVALVSSTAQSDCCDTEASALQLDGLLGCLVDTYQLFPGLVVSNEDGNSSDATLQVAKTIRICTFHPASTVRQKAGQIITLFGLAFLRIRTVQSGNLPPVVEYITQMLTEALQSTDCEQWGAQEISLMVSEELVCAVIETQLETLSNEPSSPPTTCSAMLQHTFGYLHFLKNHLSVLLGHSQFEVRRMAIQLTPQLARAYVLLNASFGSMCSTGGTDCLTPAGPVDMRIVFDREDTEFVGSGDDLDNIGTSVSVSVHNSADEYSEEKRRRSSFASDVSDTVDSVSETLHSLSHSLPHSHPTILLNSSFRSVHSIHTSATNTHQLELPLITQMIWLNELVKENQHLFEAYAVSDNWAGNTTTATLQMRSQSISMKDSDVHMKLAEYAVNTSHNSAMSRVISGKHNIPPMYSAVSVATTTHETSPTDNSSELPRGVVDHWSLDVRGRLQEIEKRTHFHRTIRSLVAAEVFAEGSKIAVLLLQNARAIVAMCEEMVFSWEKLLLTQSDAKMDFMSTLQCISGEINSAQKGVNRDGVTLSVDFLECVALMDSFLLSVQYRFAQCPDIATALYNHVVNSAGESECDPEVEMLQSSAQLLRSRLSGLTSVWVQFIARIQCVSKSSVLVSSRAGVTGQALNRETATQALLRVLDVSGNNKSDIFGNEGEMGSERADRSDFNNSCDADEASIDPELAIITKLTSILQVGEGKSHHLGGAWSNDDVLGEMLADRVYLIGSLTNASVNLSSFGAIASTLPRSAGATLTASDAATLSSPAHSTHINSQHNTPHTAYVLSPTSGFTGNTPSNRLSGHFHATQNSNLAGKFLSMDQWNCEAISPLLTCLANATSESRPALHLSCIVVEWCVACVMNPLWLDSRHNAKKNLFESLVLLLNTAETSTELLVTHDALYTSVLLAIVRGLAEILSLRSSKPLLELKTLLCCVKAATAVVRLCMRYQHHVRELFVTCAAKRFSTCESQLRLQDWMDFKHEAIAPLVHDCSTKLLQGCEYYCEVFPLHSGHHSSNNNTRVSEIPVPTPSVTHKSTAAVDAEDESSETSSSSASPSSDEFSDWDEESEADADDAPVTDFYNASGSVNTLLPLLWQDVAVLKSLLSDWSTI